MIIINHSSMKDNKKKRIIKLLSKARELTRLDIARILDISIPTVSSIISELMSEGLVEEYTAPDSSVGRKPMVVRFVPTSKYSVGVELRKSHIRVILTDLDSKIVKDMKKEFIHMDEENIIENIVGLIDEILNSEKYLKENLLGIGISLPGTVNDEKLKLEYAANYKLKDICFGEIGKIYNVPLYIENEANAGAFAESVLGSAKDMNNLIYVSITEGIGGGIIINQKLFKGKCMRAGEIGHMTINKFGNRCNCGKNGCWETYASNEALLNSYNSKSPMKTNNVSTILERYINNDKIAKNVVDEYIDDLAAGIQNLMFIFNPDYIVIGGEISKYSGALEDRLNEIVFSQNQFYSKDDITVFFSELGEDANILGAALIPVTEAFGFEKI